MGLMGIKDNKCFEPVGKPYSVVITQPADITTDTSTEWDVTFMAESSGASGSPILIPDEFFPNCAVTVTPVIHTANPAIAGAMDIVTVILSDVVGQSDDSIIVAIGHSSRNSYTIPAGTEYVVTFTEI